jgi:hypothetical protein
MQEGIKGRKQKQDGRALSNYGGELSPLRGLWLFARTAAAGLQAALGVVARLRVGACRGRTHPTALRWSQRPRLQSCPRKHQFVQLLQPACRRSRSVWSHMTHNCGVNMAWYAASARACECTCWFETQRYFAEHGGDLVVFL